mmetsp:Transcript_27161/g.58200  ORF Transcript_27161/g.58200 Transcript_27161/m.58200 type:complete len:769 (-) Transcript_27161:152-2458(-)
MDIIQNQMKTGYLPANKDNGNGSSLDSSSQSQPSRANVIDMSSGGGGSNNTYRRTSSPGNNQPNMNNNKYSNSYRGGTSPSSSPNHIKEPTPSRAKNDKAVEVHHDDKIIARFRTQTECARYLRATPEAVSYHCSKGGGICNGLVIRPLVGIESRMQYPLEYYQDSSKADEDSTSYYGLFEGATEYRPAQRPQLKPETVAILKEWLLSPEHMDNPYPNQHESEVLLLRTGLDKTQLKHWFNNARKRILKPLLKNGKGVCKKKTGTAKSEGGKKRKGKKRGSVEQLALLGGVSNTKEKEGSAKKKRKSDIGAGSVSLPASNSTLPFKIAAEASSEMHASPSLMPNGSSLCGSISAAGSTTTHKMSANLTSSQHQLQQQQLPPLDDSFQNQGQDYRHGNSNSSSNSSSSNGGNNHMMQSNRMPNHNMMQQSNEYPRLMGYDNNNNNNSSMHNRMTSSGLTQGRGSDPTINRMSNFQGRGNDPMMGYGGESMGMNTMSNSQARMLNHRRQSGGMGMDPMDAFHGYNPSDMYGGGSRCGGRSSGSVLTGMGGGGGGAGFHGCMEVNDPQGYDGNGNGRFNGYPPSRGNNNNNSHNRQGFQDNGYTNNNDGNYCQPLSQQPNNQAAAVRNQESSANPSSLDEAARSNAVFKQQVATMAMNEASTSFKDMEDAFALAKEVTAQYGNNPRHGGGNAEDDDPRVLEANGNAKKCQSVAMFKLKVSQRASEEAASAYDCYQRMLEGGNGGGFGGGSGPNRMGMGMGGNESASFRTSL